MGFPMPEDQREFISHTSAPGLKGFSKVSIFDPIIIATT